MRIIGLTGGIGSGKSTVATLFAERGAEVVDADTLAREAVAPGGEARTLILKRFGHDIVDNEGALDRKKLGRIVFNDDRARHDLNAIVHPRVAELAQARFQQAALRGVPLVIYDVPLLYENQLEGAFASVVVVDAPDDVRLRRLAERDGLTENEARSRMAAQWPLKEKAARADHVVDNGGTLEALRQQVFALHRTLVREGSS